MRLISRLLLIVALVIATLGVMTAPSQAAEGEWVLQCGFVKALPDDPIVHPGMPGMAHLHDFFGNVTVDAFSTYESMRAGATSCPAGDRAGYWLPAVLRNGTKVDPAGSGVREQIYVTADNLVPGTHIEPFPPDLRLIAGNAHAGSPGENPDLGKEIYWGCSDNSVGGKPLAPPICASGIISLHVGFPNCWDGVLTHRDDTAHVRHPEGYRCPAGFPHALPRLIIRTEYPVGAAGGAITLSSGPTYTAHGDFWNTWDQDKLSALVDNCLNAGRDCGVFRFEGISLAPATTAPATTAPATTAPATTAPATTAPTSTRRPRKPHPTRPTGRSAVAGDSAALASANEPASTGAFSDGGLAVTGAGATGSLVALAVALVGLGAALLARGRRSPRRARH